MGKIRMTGEKVAQIVSQGSVHPLRKNRTNLISSHRQGVLRRRPLHQINREFCRASNRLRHRMTYLVTITRAGMGF
jgi:hypothetical protein